MSKIEKYLGIANHDIQVANNSNELKSYVASILCEIDELQQENKQLKDNWNKLKEWLKEYEEGTYGLGSYETGLSDGLGDVIKKMQELEGSDSNVKD